MNALPIEASRTDKPRWKGRRTYTLLFLAVALLAAIRLAWPKPPFRFLEGSELAGQQLTQNGDGTIRQISIYWVKRSFREACKQAKQELDEEDWNRDSFVPQPTVSDYFAPESDFKRSLFLFPDVKILSLRGGGFSAIPAMGWTSVEYSADLPPPSRWDILWARIRSWRSGGN